MLSYKKGRRFEYKIKKIFENKGYYVVRSAGSRGIFDLIAIKKREVIGIQCKINYISGTEIYKMYETGRKYDIIPIIASKDEMYVILTCMEEPILLKITDYWCIENENYGIKEQGHSLIDVLKNAVKKICENEG